MEKDKAVITFFGALGVVGMAVAIICVAIWPDPHGEKPLAIGILALLGLGFAEWWRRSIKPTSLIRAGWQKIKEGRP